MHFYLGLQKNAPNIPAYYFRLVFSLAFLNSSFVSAFEKKGLSPLSPSLRLKNSKNMAAGIEAEQSLFPEEREFEE